MLQWMSNKNHTDFNTPLALCTLSEMHVNYKDTFKF